LPDDVEHCNSIDAALAAHASEDVFIIGGAELYAQTINRADCLFITEVQRDIPDCDALFPIIDTMLWRATSRESHEGFTFVTYERK
jgi:dihydrofolate reductase